MNFKRYVTLLLALALVLVSTGAFAETNDDAAAKIAEYEEKIAALEAQVADLQEQLALRDYVVSYDGGSVTAEEAMSRYDYVKQMYESYGYSLDGYEDQVKQDIMTSLAQEKIVQLKAEELGLAAPDAEKEAELRKHAAEDFNEYITYYSTNFKAEGKTDEDVLKETEAFLAESGMTEEALYQNQLANFARENLFAHVAGDIAVTDEDVAQEYEARVAADRASYEGNAYAYESAATSGAEIFWHPEGYRAVKQVLIAFSSEQSGRYTDITNRLKALTGELEALSATPAPEATATETAEATEAPAPRSAEEIQKDIDAAHAELEALYAELEPTAAEVAERFHAGTAIDELISVYGGDPGMTKEPTATTGYVASEGSVYWDEAFTKAAMSIENVGEISAPARGTNGIYIVYYLNDITPGAADLETVRENVKATLLETKQTEAYDAQVNAWMEEMGVTYYLDNFK